MTTIQQFLDERGGTLTDDDLRELAAIGLKSILPSSMRDEPQPATSSVPGGSAESPTAADDRYAGIEAKTKAIGMVNVTFINEDVPNADLDAISRVVAQQTSVERAAPYRAVVLNPWVGETVATVAVSIGSAATRESQVYTIGEFIGRGDTEAIVDQIGSDPVVSMCEANLQQLPNVRRFTAGPIEYAREALSSPAVMDLVVIDIQDGPEIESQIRSWLPHVANHGVLLCRGYEVDPEVTAAVDRVCKEVGINPTKDKSSSVWMLNANQYRKAVIASQPPQQPQQRPLTYEDATRNTHVAAAQ